MAAFAALIEFDAVDIDTLPASLPVRWTGYVVTVLFNEVLAHFLQVPVPDAGLGALRLTTESQFRILGC
jgi:hypothetical protein